MRRLLSILLAAAVCSAIWPAMATAAGDAPTASSAGTGFKYCGKVNIGFTDARVNAKRVKCGKARRIFREWRKASETACTPSGCPPIAVRSYTCTWRATGVEQLLVRCANATGKIVRARWGG
jgi:hypothetical protein